MARCTAPVTGKHKDSATKAKCPQCAPKVAPPGAAVSGPPPSTTVNPSGGGGVMAGEKRRDLDSGAEVVFIFLDEGYSGEYDEDDPDDAPLCRVDYFPASSPPEDDDDDYEEPEGISTCTTFRADLDDSEYEALFELFALRFGSLERDLSRGELERWGGGEWNDVHAVINLGIDHDNREALDYLRGSPDYLELTPDSPPVVAAKVMFGNREK